MKIFALQSLADICFLHVLYGTWSSISTRSGMSFVRVVICIKVYTLKLIVIHPLGSTPSHTER